MKGLFTAIDIKKMADQQRRALYVTAKTIITPAAYDAAREYGIDIVYGEPALQPSRPIERSMAEAVFPELNRDLIVQIVQEVIANMNIVKSLSQPVKEADPSGLRLVRGGSVVLDDYHTSYPQDKIKAKEIFTAKESPYMTAGFMTINDSAFTIDIKRDEIIYILDGTLEGVINGRKFTGQSGDIFYLPANIQISLSSPDKTRVFYVTHPAAKP